jgi:hypothetical protein
MKIYFERSGGFVGREFHTVVDTNQIAPEQALSLLEKVDFADFFQIPESTILGLESAAIPDEMSYKLTIEVAGVEHTVKTTELSAPEELQPLLRELNLLARSSGSQPGSDR